MNDTRQGIALRELLPPKLDRFDEAVDGGLREGGSPSQSSLAPRFVRSTVAAELDRLLDCDLFEVVAQAWGKARLLREAAGRPGHNAQVVHLGQHDFTWTLHPVVTLDFGLPTPIELRFSLDLTAMFDSAAVTVRRGHIIAVGAGEASARATLRYRDTPLHPKTQTQPLKLPGYYRLESPGIEIG